MSKKYDEVIVPNASSGRCFKLWVRTIMKVWQRDILSIVEKKGGLLRSLGKVGSDCPCVSRIRN